MLLPMLIIFPLNLIVLMLFGFKKDYAERKGMALEEVEKWMGPYLGYDPLA